MMGLKESEYYTSWFILFLAINIVMGFVIIGVLGPGLFINSNKVLVYFLCVLYGMSLFAESVLIVALLPNARSAATAATLWHVISYFLVFTL